MPNRWNGHDLSALAAIVWGKSKRDSDDWLPLWLHLADAGQVAGLLWDDWIPDRVRRIIADCLPDGHTDARKLVIWLAAIHDIGKATPSFTLQAPKLAGREAMRALPWSPHRHSYPDCAHHTVTGQFVLEHWLEDRHGWKKPQRRQFGCVVGGHHGNPPTAEMLATISDKSGKPAAGWQPHLTITGPWRMVQWELLGWAARSAQTEDRLDTWRDVTLTQQVQVLLTAIVIVSDWIASNEDYFPYVSAETPVNPDRLAIGWRLVSLPPRWQPKDVPTDIGEFYRSRFTDRDPRPLQRATVEVARQLRGPSIMVIEAPMGEGKTEAALMAAEVIAERDNSGVVFALPTRATSDGILPRIVDWLRNIADRDDAPYDLGLGHGKNRFNKQYLRLLRDGYACVDADWAPPSRISDAKQTRNLSLVAAHRWLAGRKRVLLSQFAVVTIDQILLAALKAKHVVLRHLGLAGKTVVIDEAHAYDVYMSQYLHLVVRWLAEYGCSVIVLSATLPAEKRAALVAAYQEEPSSEVPRSNAYPAIMSAGVNGTATVTACDADSTRDTTVTVEKLDETSDATPFAALINELTVSLRDGGCALIVRNTVARATQTAAALADHFRDDVAVKLVHSRFIADDRQRNDDWLRDTFGEHRPSVTAPTIVVATQVAEQSLDIDFDLLVTDLAPIDLLLQRMGRIYRHQRGIGQRDRPKPLRTARCLITGADWNQQPPVPDKGSARVYHPYTMLRAAAVLTDHEDDGSCRVGLPGDISPMVQNAYGPNPFGPIEWKSVIDGAFAHFQAEQAHREAEARRFRLAEPGAPGKSLVGWLDKGVGNVDDEPEGRGQVRDGMDTVEVLLLVERNGSWFLPDWLSEHAGAEVPREAEPSTAIGKAALSCAVSLPFWLTTDEVIAELEKRTDSAAWKNCYWLAGELVLAVDAETLSTTVAGHRIEYSPDIGLSVTKPNDDVSICHP